MLTKLTCRSGQITEEASNLSDNKIRCVAESTNKKNSFTLKYPEKEELKMMPPVKHPVYHYPPPKNQPDTSEEQEEEHTPHIPESPVTIN